MRVSELEPYAAAAIGALGSIAAGSVVIAIRRTLQHRDEANRQSVDIAVQRAQIDAIGETIQRVERKIDRVGNKVDNLPCNRCPPAEALRRTA